MAEDGAIADLTTCLLRLVKSMDLIAKIAYCSSVPDGAVAELWSAARPPPTATEEPAGVPSPSELPADAAEPDELSGPEAPTLELLPSSSAVEVALPWMRCPWSVRSVGFVCPQAASTSFAEQVSAEAAVGPGVLLPQSRCVPLMIHPS